MKLRILGCGTSAGVPRIGNDWGACDAAEPRNRRSRSSLMVETGGQRLLVDCGPDLREQLLAAEVTSIDAVIVTHDHADHCHGIDDLRPLAQNRGGPVPLHATDDVIAALRTRFAYAFAGEGLYRAVVAPHGISQGLDSALGLRFVEQPHGDTTTLGMRIDEDERSAGYAIDYNDLTDDMRSLYEGVEVWISDCLGRRPHPTHAHLDAVVGWAREMRVGALYLTHMNNSMDYASLVRELPDWAAPAHDGMEIELT